MQSENCCRKRFLGRMWNAAHDVYYNFELCELNVELNRHERHHCNERTTHTDEIIAELKTFNNQANVNSKR